MLGHGQIENKSWIKRYKCYVAEDFTQIYVFFYANHKSVKCYDIKPTCFTFLASPDARCRLPDKSQVWLVESITQPLGHVTAVLTHAHPAHTSTQPLGHVTAVLTHAHPVHTSTQPLGHVTAVLTHSHPAHTSTQPLGHVTAVLTHSHLDTHKYTATGTRHCRTHTRPPCTHKYTATGTRHCRTHTRPPCTHKYTTTGTCHCRTHTLPPCTHSHWDTSLPYSHTPTLYTQVHSHWDTSLPYSHTPTLTQTSTQPLEHVTAVLTHSHLDTNKYTATGTRHCRTHTLPP